VEEGWLTDPLTVEVAKRYISSLLGLNIDTLVLGCTHYPLIRNIIGSIVGNDVTLVNPAYETAIELKQVLLRAGIENNGSACEHKFYVSDGADKFKRFANTILPCDVVETEDVNIESFADALTTYL